MPTAFESNSPLSQLPKNCCGVGMARLRWRAMPFLWLLGVLGGRVFHLLRVFVRQFRNIATGNETAIVFGKERVVFRIGRSFDARFTVLVKDFDGQVTRVALEIGERSEQLDVGGQLV